MKLLIRTITIATIGFFMILICLHATIVETSKHEVEVANTAALNRTLDAWEKNRKLLNEGETSNLYFTTNEEFYWFFYDSLAVQLNGNIDVVIVANAVDVERGILDVDTTISFRGLDRIERNYTVHADTYGKLDEWIDDSPYRQNMMKEIADIPAGSKAQWGGNGALLNWYVLNPNDGEGVLLLYNADSESDTYTTEFSTQHYKYEYSNLNRIAQNFTNAYLTAEQKEQLSEKAIDGTNVKINGMFNGEGSHEVAVSTAFVPSFEELNGTGVLGEFWTRTMAAEDKFYIYENGAVFMDDASKTYPVRVAVKLNKRKINELEINKDPDNDGIENPKSDWIYIFS